MSQHILVRLRNSRGRSYPITIQTGLLRQVSKIIARGWRGSDVFIITDANVRRLYARLLLQGLSAHKVNARLLYFSAGEKSKNARVVSALHTQLLNQGIRRDSLIIALGGGVVGDVAGFVAATVLRGVEYVQVPTTLLAQVDSSVGGKVGIDHQLGKNLIGAFHQPAAVFIDPNVLRTLPTAEFKNGLAEIVKIAAALDRKLFEKLERNAARITRGSSRLLYSLIAESVRLKVAVVEKDEFESGIRKTLNLGHTIGHAIEAASDYGGKHGEAVAIGLAAEAKIAVELGLLTEDDYSSVLSLLHAFQLPTKFPHIKSRSKFLTALSADKKSEVDTTRFVLLKRIGHSVIGVDVPTPFLSELTGRSR
ncbi:MAG: 3-dehydroquinate synthase [Ignavibacteria bacterium]|nr:3-dehydroquinate synthase [Ignavibacteria bacterium]